MLMCLKRFSRKTMARFVSFHFARKCLQGYFPFLGISAIVGISQHAWWSCFTGLFGMMSLIVATFEAVSVFDEVS